MERLDLTLIRGHAALQHSTRIEHPPNCFNPLPNFRVSFSLDEGVYPIVSWQQHP